MKIFFLVTILNLLVAFECKSQSVLIEKNKVLQYFQEQEYDEAIAYLQPAFRSDSTNIDLIGFLGYANYMTDNYKLAEVYYEKILHIDSGNVAALRYLSAINENANTPKALSFMTRIVALQPAKAAYNRSMGDLLKKLNLSDSALTYYNRAYTLAPGDNRNVAALVTILLDRKNYVSADSILNPALQKDSLNISFLKLKVRSAYEAKDYQGAVPSGEKIIALKETPLSTLTQLVLSYYNLKMYNECIRACEYMLSNDLDVEAIYYYEAKALAKIKEYRKSNELLQICLDKAISKDAEMYYYNLGQNYESLKLYKNAIAAYDTAYYLFKDPVMNYNIGGIYESNLKNPRQAHLYYQKYLRAAKPSTAAEIKAYEYVRSRQAKLKEIPAAIKK